MTEAQKLPNAYEVVFYNETEDSPGMMLWRYPEPRVLTLVKINPVPFNTTEDPDISTADLGDVLQVGNEFSTFSYKWKHYCCKVKVFKFRFIKKEHKTNVRSSIKPI